MTAVRLATTRAGTPAFAAVLVGSALLVAYTLSSGNALYALAAFAFAILPLAAMGFFALAASSRTLLVGLALGLSLTTNLLNAGVPVFGNVVVFVADIVVALAVAAWVVGTARTRTEEEEERPPFRSALLPWPLAIFGSVMIIDAVRGHYAHGASLVGQPLRLVIYAGIAAAMTDLDPQKVYRLLVGVFYGGAVWQFLAAIYHIASGTSQTESFALSTGGERYVAITVSLYLVGSLLLALLNFEYDVLGGRRVWHLVIALISLVTIVLSFARGTFVAMAMIIPVLALTLRGVRRAIMWLLPAAVPIVAAVAFFAPHYTAKVVPTLQARLTTSLGTDQSVQWRLKANEAILQQFHRSPIFGVGFGEGASFSSNWNWVTITQDPHDDYLYLLAGGGIVALATFALLLIAFVYDVWRRRHVRDPQSRLILIWASSMLFLFLTNSIAEPLMTAPSILLTVWTLFLLPATIRRNASAPAL